MVEDLETTLREMFAEWHPPSTMVIHDGMEMVDRLQDEAVVSLQGNLLEYWNKWIVRWSSLHHVKDQGMTTKEAQTFIFKCFSAILRRRGRIYTVDAAD